MFKTKEREQKVGARLHSAVSDPSGSLSENLTTTSSRINYYLLRGDNKEGWDNIADPAGWLGYKMQLKDQPSSCRDSILAAPIYIYLALFLDLAKARGHVWASRSGLFVLLQKPHACPRVSP